MSLWFPEGVRSMWPVRRAGSAVLCLEDMNTDAIERQLDAFAPRTRLTCILAGEGVRYRIVPWSDSLSQPAQRQKLAEQCCIDAYGEVARSWTVRQHSVRHGAATLACAIDTAVLSRIESMAQARRLRLVSIQPLLMPAYKRVRHQIARGLHWFVLIESGWTTLLLMSPNEPLQVKRLPATDIDLPQALDREWFALGIEAARCPVYLVRAAAQPMATSAVVRHPMLSSWEIVDLTTSSHDRPGFTPAPSAPTQTSIA